MKHASNGSTTFTVQLYHTDWDNLKYYTNLAVNENSTNLVMGSSAVTDMAGNQVEHIPSSYAMKCASFTEDTTDPELVSFDLDMDTGVMSLTFTESMKSWRSLYSLITLNEQPRSSVGNSLTLRGGVFSGYEEPPRNL